MWRLLHFIFLRCILLLVFFIHFSITIPHTFAMGISSILPSWRRMLFSILILALVANFFGGYYFYYAPFNKQDVRKQAFISWPTLAKLPMKKYPYRKAAGKPCKTTITGQAKPGFFKTSIASKTGGLLCLFIEQMHRQRKIPVVKLCTAGLCQF